MKRNLLFILVALLPVVASAYDAKIDGIYYNFSEGNAVVTRNNIDAGSYSGDVSIPESVTYNGNTYSVTSIDIGAFGYSSKLTSVNIPESVTNIGSSAFVACSALISVTIPNGVTSIEKMTFWGCSGLTSVTLPSNLTHIGYLTFAFCITSCDSTLTIYPYTKIYAPTS